MPNYTQNYGLHQWEPGDDFLRSDFNQDFAKIDAAVKEVETVAERKKADKSELAALRSQVDEKTSLVIGQYTGNGTALTVTLGFRPAAVFIPIYQRYMAATFRGQAPQLVTLTDDGFTVQLGNDTIVTPNQSGSIYTYLAFR